MLHAVAEKIDLHAYWPLSPFPGLRPFQSTDKPDESLVFYGRNREKDEILARLNSSHLVFVVGPSGCGKSSLVKVGVLPALEAGLLTRAGSNWRIAETRPGDRPLRNLAASLAAFAPDEAARGQFADDVFRVLSKERNGLWLVAENVAPREKSRPLLIVIDQFEEIFGSQVTSQEECKLLLDAIISFTEKPHPNMYLIATMRTDFLGRCANFPKLADVINATLFITPVLRDEDLKSVIAMPVEDYHGSIEPELVKAIVKDASSELGYDPDHLPLLQHALLWLWNEVLAAAGLTGSPPAPNAEPPEPPVALTYRMYTEHGGLKGILNCHADRIYLGLSERQQRIAETMFRRISERDAENRYRRSPATVETIAKLAGCTPAELEEVIRGFSHPDVSFIECRRLANDAGELVDLSHESLIRQWDRLRNWADEEAEKIRRFRDISGSAANWDDHGRSNDFLKSGGEIDIYEQRWKSDAPTALWAARYAPGPVGNAADMVALTRQYLDKSRKLHNWYAWRHWFAWVTPFAAAALLIVGVAMFTAYFQRQDAIAQKKAAEDLAQLRNQFLVARGQEYLEDESPTLALLLALNGVVYSSDLERLAYESLQNLRAKVVFKTRNQFPTAGFSPDGRTLLYADGSQLVFWDLATRRRLDSYVPRGVNPTMRSKWSDDGKWLISSNDKNQTVLWAPCSRSDLRALFATCDSKWQDVVRTIGAQDVGSWPGILSPKGDMLVSGGWGTSARFWDLRKEPLEPFTLNVASVGFSLTFDRTSNRFAVGTTKGSVQIRSSAKPEDVSFTLDLPRKGRASQKGETADDPDAALPLPVSALAFNPKNENQLVAATNDGRLTLWDLNTHEVINTLATERTGWINVAFDRTGNLIGVTSQEGYILMWDPKTNDQTKLIGHRQATWTVEFNKTSDLLVSASADSIRVWDTAPALAPSPLEKLPELLGVSAISPQQDAIPVRDARTGRTVTFKLPPAEESPLAAAVSPDGRRVLVVERTRLALYASEESLGGPLAVFEVRGVEWKTGGFVQNPDRIVGQTSDGKSFAWPFFNDMKSLDDFASKNLPVNAAGSRARLTFRDQCRLGIQVARESCRDAEPVDPLSQSADDTQW